MAGDVIGAKARASVSGPLYLQGYDTEREFVLLWRVRLRYEGEAGGVVLPLANGRGSIYVAMESVVIDGCSFDSCVSSSDTVALSSEGVRADSNSFSVVISKCICWNCSSYCHVFKVQYQDADVYNCAFDSCGAYLNLWSVMNG